MSIPIDSQNLESYVPVYDAIPDEWDEAKPFLVEQLKKITNAVNIREIGWYLDEELLSGGAFVPGASIVADGGSSQQTRSILRKVILFPILNVGINTQPHGITIDGNFTLIKMSASATNATLFTGEPIPNNADTLSYDSMNVIITTAAAWTRAVCIIEYIQEL